MVEFRSNKDAKGYSIKLWVDQISQSVSNNTSQVRLRLFLVNTNTTFSQYTVNASVTADGQRVSYSGHPSVLSYNSTTQLLDKTITVNHNSDGAKTFSVSASLSGSGGYSPNTISIGNQSFKLTTIPRASTIRGQDVNLGLPMSITISCASSSFNHTIRWAFGSQSGTVASGVGTSTSWTPALLLGTEIPNSTNGVATLYVDTYSGSTKIGTSQTSVTLSMPNNSATQPSLAGITLTDTNTKAQNLITGNHFIQIISNIRVAFNESSAQYGASIANYHAEIVGKNQAINVNGGQLGIMNWSGQAIVRAIVTDSRGFTSKAVDVPIMVIPYSPPALSFTARRGNQSESSKTIVVTRNAQIAPLMVDDVQKNTFKLTFKVSEAGKNNYVTDNSLANVNATTINTLINSNANLAGIYDNLKSYDVLGILEDAFTSTEFRVTVTTERGVMGMAEHAVSFGKVPELTDAVDSDWPYYYKNKPIQHHQLTDKNGLVMTVFDANLVKSTGFYYVDGTRDNVPGNQNGYLTVWSRSDRLICQMFMPYNATDIYTRRMTNGTWGSWSSLAVQNTSASFSNVNITDTATSHFTIMWEFGVSAVRKGNLVTLSLERAIHDVRSTYEYELMNETIPSGFRPISEAHWVVVANTGNTISGTSVIHIASDGRLRFTNAITGNRVWTGTITYITNDSYSS